MQVGEVTLAVVVGYVVGTLPTAGTVTRIASAGRLEIRRVGSGNPGALNTMRAVGWGWGLLVAVVDVAKGVLAGVLGARLGGDAGVYAAGTAAIAGHALPVWSRLAGGRGVAVAAGALGVMAPLVLAVAAGVAVLGSVTIRDPAALARLSVTAWVAAAAIWWAARPPVLWGPEPALGLLLASLAGGAIVAWRFGPGAPRPV